MPIIYDSQNKTFKLDTATSSYIIKIYDENYILNLYYGAKIPDTYVPHRECVSPNASFSLANPVIGEHGFRQTAPLWSTVQTALRFQNFGTCQSEIQTVTA